MTEQLISKAQLLVIMERFLKDQKRGISISMFSDLAGIHMSHLRDVFLYKNEPLTEWVQRRVTRAYLRYQAGDVAVMQNRDRTRYLQMRSQPKPKIVKGFNIQSDGKTLSLKIGLKNKTDYSYQTLDETLGGN